MRVVVTQSFCGPTNVYVDNAEVEVAILDFGVDEQDAADLKPEGVIYTAKQYRGAARIVDPPAVERVFQAPLPTCPVHIKFLPPDGGAFEKTLFEDEHYYSINTVLGVQDLFDAEHGTVPTPQGIVRLFRLLELKNNARFTVVFYLHADGTLAATSIESAPPEESELLTPFHALRRAIFLTAESMVIAHNLPGDPEPRPTPRVVDRTLELQTAGAYLGVQVRDHVVTGGGKPDASDRPFFSFLENGVLPPALQAPGRKRR